jgi:hypothetical protein
MQSTIPGKLAYLCIIAIFALCNFSHAAAQQIAELRESGLHVVLSKKAADFEVAITPEKGLSGLTTDLTANVFAIENPTRLVIDIPNQKAKGTRALAINNPVFTSLRIGQHPDKIRLVFDIKDNRQLNYNISSDANRQALLVDVSFSERSSGNETPSSAGYNREPETASAELNLEERAPAEESAPQKVKAAPERAAAKAPPEPASDDFNFEQPETAKPPAKAKANPVKEEPPAPKQPLPKENEWEAPLSPPASSKTKPQETAKPIDDGLFNPPPRAEDRAPIESPEQAQESLKSELALQMKDSSTSPGPITSAAAKVSGIYYQSPKDSNVSAVQIDVDAHSTYSLTQRDNNRFELVINNAALAGSHLSLPQFPPDTFSGFEVILARSQGQDVVVNIYVEDGVKLSPFIAKGKLWLKVIK